MTVEEFSTTAFHGGMVFLYHGITYPLCSINFPERLLGLGEDDDIMWVRCENAELEPDDTTTDELERTA